MLYSYQDVTVAASEAILDMGVGAEVDADARRVAAVGVYLLWAHLVGDTAPDEDTESIMAMVDGIR